MTYQLVAYETLKELIKQSIDTLLVEHKLKTAEEEKLSDYARDKRVQGLKGKHAERYIQSKYLLKVIESLDANATLIEKDKSMIFNAAAYYIHAQIKTSYETGTLTYIPIIGGFFTSPKKNSFGGSGFYDSLGVALNLREGNQPDNQDTHVLYTALLQFMENEVYDPNSPIKVFKPNHCFTEEQIAGYKVGQDIKKLSKLQLELKGKFIDLAEKAHVSSKNEDSVSNPILRQENLTSSILSDYSKPEQVINQDDFDAFFVESSTEALEEKADEVEAEKGVQEDTLTTPSFS